MPVREGTDLDTPAPWSVLQCVGQYILQYRVHFVLVNLKSVDGLLGLVTSLIDFESTDNYTLRLHVSEYELNSYLEYSSFSSPSR